MIPLRKQPRFFYGWWIAFSCAAITAISAGVSFWSFGVLILPLEQEFRWMRGEIAGAFSVSWLIAGVIGPVIGRAVDHYGARPLIVWGTLTAGLCFGLLATTQNLWQFFLFHSLLSFCRAWMFYIPLSALITRWFVRRRAIALAIFTSGFAVGGVVFVPLLTFLANTVGWRWTYLFCGAALYTVVLPLGFWILRSRPEDLGLTADGEPQPPPAVPSAADPALQTASAPASEIPSWTVREAVGSQAFWLLALGFSLTFLTQIAFSVHAIPFFVSRGLSPESGAGVISAATALTGLLRVPFGYVIDRTPSVRAIMLLILGTQGLSFLVLLISVEPLALSGFILFAGFTGGGMPLLESAFIFRIFGDRHYGALLGTLGLVETAGSLLGPVLAGVVFDATGSYSWALIFSLVTTLFAFGCFLAFSPPKPRNIGEQT